MALVRPVRSAPIEWPQPTVVAITADQLSVIPGLGEAENPEPIFQRPVFLGSGFAATRRPGMTKGLTRTWLSTFRQGEQAVRVQPVILCLDVFAAVETGRDHHLADLPSLGNIKAPPPFLDTGDRGGFADQPARPIRVDPADLPDAAVMVHEVTALNAVDLVARRHRELSFTLGFGQLRT